MKTLQFVAMVLTALTLVPDGAHLFALPNKIHLNETDYFITQRVYSGWSLFGIVLICFYVSGQSGNEQLDASPRQLGAIALAMGVLARHQRSNHIRWLLFPDDIGFAGEEVAMGRNKTNTSHLAGPHLVRRETITHHGTGRTLGFGQPPNPVVRGR
jgi:hypothetical protein